MRTHSAFIVAVILSLTVAGGVAADPQPLVLAFANPVDDENTPSESEIVLAVIEEFRATGRVEVIAFNRDLPVIARAVLERKLDNQTLGQTADPRKAVQVAAVMGANYALCIQGSVKGSEVNVLLHLLAVPGGENYTAVAKTEIAAGTGLREPVVRSNAISTAASSAVSQLAIELFGQAAVLESPAVAAERTPAVPTRPSPLPDGPRAKEPRDTHKEFSEVMKQVDLYMNRKDHRNAVVELRRAINLKPHNPAPRVQLANLYAEMGMTAEAMDECMRTLLFDEDNIAVREMLMKLYAQSALLDEAAQQCREIVRLDPKNVDARLALGDLSWNLRNMDEAESAYLKAAEIAPEETAPQERLQRLYMAQRKYAPALRHMLRARTLALSPEAQAPEHYGILADIVHSEFSSAAGKLDSARDEFALGLISREEYYQLCLDAVDHINALSELLSSYKAPEAFSSAHPHGVLAVSLLAQAAGYTVSYLETHRDHYAEQARLIQSEARTEIRLYTGAVRRT